jgi:hypothetical protein
MFISQHDKNSGHFTQSKALFKKNNVSKTESFPAFRWQDGGIEEWMNPMGPSDGYPQSLDNSSSWKANNVF